MKLTLAQVSFPSRHELVPPFGLFALANRGLGYERFSSELKITYFKLNTQIPMHRDCFG